MSAALNAQNTIQAHILHQFCVQQHCSAGYLPNYYILRIHFMRVRRAGETRKMYGLQTAKTNHRYQANVDECVTFNCTPVIQWHNQAPIADNHRSNWLVNKSESI